MEFAFDDKLAQLRDWGSDIGRTLVEPSVVTRDQTATWDSGLFSTLAKTGLAGMLLPTSVGGLGLTVLEAVALLEGLGESTGDAGLALALGVHGLLCAVPTATLGTPAQRDRYLTSITSGERLCGTALSELDGGATASGVGVTASPVRGGWLLEGVRPHVVNGPFADLFLVTATIAGHGTGTGTGTAASNGAVAGAAPSHRIAFLVDRDTPGLAVLPQQTTTALRTAPVADLVLIGCRVTEDAVLGTPGGAAAELVPLLAALDRTCLLAPWLGILRALAEHTLTLATEQPLLSGRLFRSQSVRLAAADVQAQVELGAGLLYRAAWQLGRLVPAPRQDAASAKLFLTRAVGQAARTAAGFAGLTPSSLVERICRDVRALAATGGGEEILRPVIAGALLNVG